MQAYIYNLEIHYDLSYDGYSFPNNETAKHFPESATPTRATAFFDKCTGDESLGFVKELNSTGVLYELTIRKGCLAQVYLTTSIQLMDAFLTWFYGGWDSINSAREERRILTFSAPCSRVSHRDNCLRLFEKLRKGERLQLEARNVE